MNGWRVGELHWGGYATKARVKGDWLVCTNEICVPESATLTLRLGQGEAPRDPRFDRWRAAIP